MNPVRTWIIALLPVSVTLGAAWAIAAPLTLEPLCRVRAGAAGGQEWAFVAPQADLFDAGGRREVCDAAGTGPHRPAGEGHRAQARMAESPEYHFFE